MIGPALVCTAQTFDVFWNAQSHEQVVDEICPRDHRLLIGSDRQEGAPIPRGGVRRRPPQAFSTTGSVSGHDARSRSLP